MILKIVEREEDYQEIKQMREIVFCKELKIQESDFKDPFNDRDALVFCVENKGEKIGSARIVFSKTDCKFYFSYFHVLSSFRYQMAGLYLLGGLLYFMKLSGVMQILAHAHEGVFGLYTKLGFVKISDPFKKPGFQCDWVKMEYLWSTNKEIEEYSISKVRDNINDNKIRLFCEKHLVKLK